MSESECNALLRRIREALEDRDAGTARMQTRKARRQQCIGKGTSGRISRALSDEDFGAALDALDRAEGMGPLQAQRDDRLGGGDRDRRQTGRGSEAETPEQGQTQFGEGGEMEGQGTLGGDLAGGRERRGDRDRGGNGGGGDDDDRTAQGTLTGGRASEERMQERGGGGGAEPPEGVSSLREFAQENGGNGNGGNGDPPIRVEVRRDSSAEGGLSVDAVDETRVPPVGLPSNAVREIKQAVQREMDAEGVIMQRVDNGTLVARASLGPNAFGVEDLELLDFR